MALFKKCSDQRQYVPDTPQASSYDKKTFTPDNSIVVRSSRSATAPVNVIEDETVKCINCGSTNIFKKRKGYNYALAAISGLFIGLFGILLGFIGRNKIVCICLDCNFKWKCEDIKKLPAN